MKRILKYLLNYKLLLVLLLIANISQAYTGLKIPKYIGDLVNIGIQNAGVGNEIPKEISKELYIAVESVPEFKNKYKLNGEKAILTDKNFNYEKLSSILISNIGRKIDVSSLEAIKKADITAIKTEFCNIENDKANQILQNAENKLNIINYILLGKNINDIQIAYIKSVGLLMSVVTIIFTLSTIIVCYIAAYIGSGIAKNIASELYKKIMYLPAKDYDKLSTSSLISRCTTDINNIRNFLIGLFRKIINSFAVGIGAVILIIQKSGKITFLLGFLLIFIVVFFIVINLYLIKLIDIFFGNVDKINLYSRENVGGLLTIRGFNREKFEIDKFSKINNEQKSIDIKLYRYFGISDYIIDFMLNITIICLIWFGAKAIEKSTLMVGDLLSFIQYIAYVVFSILGILYILYDVPRVKISLRRINEVFKIKNEVKVRETVLNEIKDIEFKNVDFSYDSESVLKDINLKIRHGECVAIVGSTGSGKSTLVKLLLNIYSTTKGKILLNGINVEEINKTSIIEHITIAPQTSILFKGTIKDNILYGRKEASDKEIDEVLKITDSYDFIYKKKGLDTDIAQEAKNLSGGQKQRLSMARALIKEADVYIFDDCFSALDVKTDEAVREAIFNRLREKTIIIVAQRLSTIIGADKIVVMNEGKIEAIGKHSELLEKSSLYNEIYMSQRGYYEE